MKSERRVVVNHTFVGGRFQDHGMDVDALQELVRYKCLVVALTKELWRSKHPERSRLPSHFDDEMGLKIYQLVPNCVTIPLERLVSTPAQQTFLDDDADVDLVRAVELIAEAIEAADKDEPLPNEFPKQLLSQFREYGSTLRPDEWIEQQPPGWTHSARFDVRVRENIIRRIDSSYVGAIDLVGVVTMARVNRPRMAIQLMNGHEIEAIFQPEHEADIVAALKDHNTSKVRVVGNGQYSGSGELQRIIDVQKVIFLAHGETPFDATSKPIWLKFQEIVSGLPLEAFDGLPRDGATHHDSYM